jgi:hypothetical protein
MSGFVSDLARPPRVDVDGNLDLLTEAAEDRHQAIDREAAEIGAADRSVSQRHVSVG